MVMLTPAAYAIQVFGGVARLAKALGTSMSTVSRWQLRRSDTPGMIPAPAQKKILAIARERKLPITAEDLILGREVALTPAR